MEIKLPIETFQIHYVCDKCEKGLMKTHGSPYITSPRQFPHKCENCGHTENFLHKYPYIKQVVKE